MGPVITFVVSAISPSKHKGGGYYSYNCSNVEIEPHEHMSWQL